MAIAFDTSTQSALSTFSHTCTGSNLVLIVAISSRAQDVSGVTYNGVAMTLVNSIATAGVFKTYIYLLANPTTGANSVVISGITDTWRSFSASYTGASGVDSSNTGHDTDSNVTVSTTVVAAGCWLIGIGSSFSASASAITSNRTDRRAGTYFSAIDATCLSDSNGTVATGAQSITFTNSGVTPNPTDGVVMSLAPVASAIAKVSSVSYADVSKVNSVAKASIAKISSVA